MKFYTEDEALDRVLGKEGTPLREQYDSEMRNFLMKSLAEYAIKEHRAGRCISQDQVENDIMESMGWK